MESVVPVWRMSSEPANADEVAIVTGGTAGIGYETVRALADRGADVGIVARTEADCEAVAAEVREEFGTGALPLPADVGDEAEATEVIERTVNEFGRLDVLVNNAGVAVGGGVPVEEITTEDLQTTIRTNVEGVFFTTRAALPHLKETEGHLVYVGSFAGQYPRPFNPLYAASKYWVRGFAHSVEASEGEDGVAVTVVNPSEVRTASWADTYDEWEITEPVEVARAIAFATTFTNSSISELDIYRRDKLSTL